MQIPIKLKKLGNQLILAAILIFIGYLLSTSIGLGRSGLTQTEIFQQYTFYLNGGLFLLGVILLFVASLILEDEKYGSSLWFNSPGETPAIQTGFLKNPWRLFLFSLMIFSVLGIVSTLSNTSFTGVGKLTAQQFTVTDNILFSSLLVPISENLYLAFLIAFELFIIRAIAKKYDWSKNNFIITSIILITISSGIFGVINHIMKYSGQEIALMTVAFFWTLGGLITALSGSFIIFWVMHISNNLFYMLRTSFSSEFALSIAGAIAIVSFILFVLTLFSKKKQENFIK